MPSPDPPVDDGQHDQPADDGQHDPPAGGGQPDDGAAAGHGLWRHQPALDGVRGLAVAAVLVFHARPDWLPGGFLGVDAFFVLSGFLITGLLLTERERTGRIRLGAFWGRRARRLLPALLIVLATVVAVSRYLLPREELRGLRYDALAALGYVSNWRMIYRGGDYFEQTAPASPLQHTWSLGIEEQFYLIWPLVVVLTLAVALRRSRAVIMAIAITGTVVSAILAAALYHPAADPGRAYYGTDARAGALLVGCALAAAVAGRSPRPNRVLGLLALLSAVALGTAWAVADGADGWLYRGGLTALGVAVTVVIAHLVSAPGGLAARALALAPLAWLGRVSYGLYLWHWPLFQWLTADRTGVTGAALFGVRLAITFALASLSFYLVEQPIRRNLSRPAGRHFPRRALVPVTVAALAATAFIAVIGTRPPDLRSGPALAAPPVPAAETTPDAIAPIARPGRRAGALPRITILGDSVAWTVGTYLPAHPEVSVTNRAIQGCGIARLPDVRYVGAPHTNYPGCDKWDERWRSMVAGDDPDVSVILLDRWELMDRQLNGRYQAVGDPEFDGYLTDELNLAISIAAGNGARVVLLTAPYTRRSERPDGGLYPEDLPERVQAWNRLLSAVAEASPDHPIILDLNRLVCPDGQFTWTLDGVRIRSDGLHFTPAGVQQFVAPWLLPQLTRLATAP